jgi:hypothetical protein
LPWSGPTTPEVRQDALPAVENHPGHQARRDFDHHRPAFFEIDERGDVGRRVVWSENAELLREIEIGQHLAAFRFEDVEV